MYCSNDVIDEICFLSFTGCICFNFGTVLVTARETANRDSTHREMYN